MYKYHLSSCPHVTYNGDDIKRKNSGAGIGIGKKYDFS